VTVFTFLMMILRTSYRLMMSLNCYGSRCCWNCCGSERCKSCCWNCCGSERCKSFCWSCCGSERCRNCGLNCCSGHCRNCFLNLCSGGYKNCWYLTVMGYNSFPFLQVLNCGTGLWYYKLVWYLSLAYCNSVYRSCFEVLPMNPCPWEYLAQQAW